MTRPKRMDARRARSAGDKTLMAALYEFTNLRELVGRGGGLVQRPAPSGEQHEAPRTRPSSYAAWKSTGLAPSLINTPTPCHTDRRAPVSADFALQAEAADHADVVETALCSRVAPVVTPTLILSEMQREAPTVGPWAPICVSSESTPSDLRIFSKALPPPSPPASCAAASGGR